MVAARAAWEFCFSSEDSMAGKFHRDGRGSVGSCPGNSTAPACGIWGSYSLVDHFDKTVIVWSTKPPAGQSCLTICMCLVCNTSTLAVPGLFCCSRPSPVQPDWPC